MRLPRFNLLNPFKQLYHEAHLDKRTRKELNWIYRSNTCGNINALVCAAGTTAMVGLATELGADDMYLGLLVAIPQIAAFFQIPFSNLVNRFGHRKLLLLSFGVTARIFWLLFGFLPLLAHGPNTPLPRTLLITMLSISSVLGAMINVCWFPWFSELSPLQIRGRWLSIRDAIVAGVNICFSILFSFLLDTLTVPTRYIVVFLIGGIVGILDMLCYMPLHDIPIPKAQYTPLFASVRKVLRNKPFMNFTIMWTIWCFTSNMCGSYMIPYSMNVMGLTFTQIMICGTVVASLATIIAVPTWGRFIDRYGSRNVMMVSCLITAFNPLFYLLSTPGNVWPVLLHNLFGATFWCGSNLSANSQQLFASPTEGRSTYIAVFSCIACLLGTALGTLSGGWFLNLCVANQWFVGTFDRYKALMAFSVVLRVIGVVACVPHMSNEHECTVSDMLRSVFKIRK